MNFISKLVNLIKDEDFVFIQTHNFPDHDAVSSAFGLQNILEKFSIKSYLVYEGEIQRDSLKRMIKQLDIDIQKNTHYDMVASDKIIIVDGCKGNKNVTDLIGDEIAVIDHHIINDPEDVKLIYIKPQYGSCSTIIYSFYDSLKIEINQRVATALLIGLNMDTALLTREVSEEDINAYASLYTRADISLVNSILRNYIQVKDLDFYKKAINNVKIFKSFAYCFFPEGCNQNLLGILGDFLLALKEIDFVVLAANNKGKINFSLRSERNDWNAARIIQDALYSIGFGGGHTDMAGGIINKAELFNEKDFYHKFINILNL